MGGQIWEEYTWNDGRWQDSSGSVVTDRERRALTELLKSADAS